LTPERAITADPGLSLLQKTLLITDGTVTQLLEVFTGENIRVEKLEHRLVEGGPKLLGAGPSEPVLSRVILLRGPVRPYMYAHSWLVPGRMPRDMQEAMRATDVPIGQLWKTSRLETYREIVQYRREEDPEVARLLGTPGPLLSRSYLIHTRGQPMGLIAEKFPAALFA
jgi:chorismate-pyruvate lyase